MYLRSINFALNGTYHRKFCRKSLKSIEINMGSQTSVTLNMDDVFVWPLYICSLFNIMLTLGFW